MSYHNTYTLVNARRFKTSDVNQLKYRILNAASSLIKQHNYWKPYLVITIITNTHKYITFETNGLRDSSWQTKSKKKKPGYSKQVDTFVYSGIDVLWVRHVRRGMWRSDSTGCGGGGVAVWHLAAYTWPADTCCLRYYTLLLRLSPSPFCCLTYSVPCSTASSLHPALFCLITSSLTSS